MHPQIGLILLLFSVPFIFIAAVGLMLYARHNDMQLKYLFRYFKKMDNESLRLLSKLPYYSNLSPAKKNIFQKRVIHFLVNKPILMNTGEEASLEQKIMTSAAAIQISFGLQASYLGYFKRIVLYPEKTDLNFNLEVSEEGYIYVSWKKFHESCKNNSDGINPGLQAMAIALMVENKLIEGASKVFTDGRYASWKKVYKEEKDRFIRKLPALFPQRYLEKEEFFSFCVSYFFEKPDHFEEINPRLYKAIRHLLNQ